MRCGCRVSAAVRDAADIVRCLLLWSAECVGCSERCCRHRALSVVVKCRVCRLQWEMLPTSCAVCCFAVPSVSWVSWTDLLMKTHWLMWVIIPHMPCCCRVMKWMMLLPFHFTCTLRNCLSIVCVMYYAPVLSDLLLSFMQFYHDCVHTNTFAVDFKMLWRRRYFVIVACA